MPPRCPALHGTLTPFLYPLLLHQVSLTLTLRPFSTTIYHHRDLTTSANPNPTSQTTHLNPSPTDYSRNLFSDRANITIHAGSGGHGCISFLREKYIAAGPANGGDGGTGGNIYIQAVRGETSLHKLARRNILRAGRGRNGQGKTQGGERGEDIIIHVPVGTVIRELERHDPRAIEEQNSRLSAGREDSTAAEAETANTRGPWKWDREKWLLYPALTPEDIRTAEFPSLPRPRASALVSAQVPAPISLDLSVPMDRPLLLAAGAVGGLGNPHFVTKTVPRPKFATKGAEGMQVTLTLELKLLADVGLVGLPNAGKSTLLRSVSRSRARVGDWAFTTLQPNIGTVVLDDYKGRPKAGRVTYDTGELRTGFTIADIPGLVEGAHLDRGLGVSFLRHVERARVLAFVVDLSAGNAVEVLKGLWKEVGEYERMKVEEDERAKNDVVDWTPFSTDGEEHIIVESGNHFGTPMKPGPPQIASKPWFVVATKADIEGTQERFEALNAWVESVNKKEVEHPSGQSRERIWGGRVEVVPVSAINGLGVERITECVVGLLDG